MPAPDLPTSQLKSNLQGQLIIPTDAAYDAARAVWNGMIDKRPRLIVQCAGEKDVETALQFARAHNLLVAVRGGGHNVAGLATCDDGIVIDLSPMKGIQVDPVARTARAQAGLTWGEFDQATQRHALATTGGLVSTTGIAGFTLGGGFGWLVRKYGLTVDNLCAVEMVLADGSCLKASASENPELFWAVRGGGGNFGIVTSFTYQLHPVGPQVYGGAIFHPVSRAKEFLRFYRDWTRTLPDELSTMFAFLIAPPAPFVPKELVGTPMVAVALCYTGASSDGEKTVQPLRSFAPPAIDLVGPIPYLALQTMFDATAPKGIHAYWKTQYLSDLTDPAIATLVEHSARLTQLSPFSAVHVHHWEGAVARVKPGETAFANRSARYVLNVLGLWTAGESADHHIRWVRSFSDAAAALSTGHAYLNFLSDEGEDRVRAAYDPAAWSRLSQLKRRYDPGNFFRVNQNIRPGS